MSVRVTRRLVATAWLLAMVAIVFSPACSGGAFEPGKGAPDGSVDEGADSGSEVQEASVRLPEADVILDGAVGVSDASLGAQESSVPVDDSGAGPDDRVATLQKDAGFGGDASGCLAPTSLSCQGTCVDPTTDPLHCGSCSNKCPAPPSMHGRALCAARADGGASCDVACPSAFHACNGDCFSNANPPSPAVDPCILTERFGVFVSPSGSDALGDGSRVHPYATIGHAMDRAVGLTNRVFACSNAGDYSENLVVSPSPPRDGVRVYGGLDCKKTPENWTYNAGFLTAVAPPTGMALRVSVLILGVTFEDFAFRAGLPPAGPSGPVGGSSIAVVIDGAANAVFTRSKMIAGNGQPGAAGPPSPYTFPTAMQLQGNYGTTATGGAAQAVLCPAGDTTIGGKGGDPPAGDGSTGLPLGVYNAGTSALCFAYASPAMAGRDGDSGAGARSLGSLSLANWVPQAGVPGTPGGAAQGGGGGAASQGLGGNGGGAGGCGGAAGAAGAGGGASLALIAANAPGLRLEGVTLTTGAGGAGGAGAGGQPGQTGGLGTVGLCASGNGGPGGNGGAGGGGAGGISVGILYTGPPPLLDAKTQSSFQLGQGGAPGVGGLPGINDGIAGTSALLLATP